MSKQTTAIVSVIVIIAVLIIAVATLPRSGPANSVTTDNNSNSTSTKGTTNTSYTLAQVALHATKTDCWTAINGSVYNLTPFIPNHPGGDAILAICGIDGTSAFDNQHEGQRRPAAELATLKIGVLAN